MFQIGGVGPTQGQANVFFRYAPEKIPYAIERYQNETKRLYTVLDRRLGESESLAGEYSIADISTGPWVSIHAWAGVEIADLPNRVRWLAVVGARPAVAKVRAVRASIDTATRAEDVKKAGARMLV